MATPARAPARSRMAIDKYDEVRQLISIGKKNGYVLYDEIHNLLPGSIQSSEEIDDLLSTFERYGIKVYETSQRESLPMKKQPIEPYKGAEQMSPAPELNAVPVSVASTSLVPNNVLTSRVDYRATVSLLRLHIESLEKRLAQSEAELRGERAVTAAILATVRTAAGGPKQSEEARTQQPQLMQ